MLAAELRSDIRAAWSRRSVWFAGGVLVLAVVGAYYNTYGVPFVFDDIPSILRNPTIRDFGESLLPPADTTVTGRPIANLTLALNWALNGDRVWSYHGLNVLIHAAAALVLFGLVRRTLQQSLLRARYGTVAQPLAMTVAVLWALHPLQTESVTYISQRVESLMGLFYLLTLYGFVRSVEAERSWPWQVLSVTACALGMATKEVMVSAPLMVLLYDRTFVEGTWRNALARRRIYYSSLAGTWLLLAWLAAGTHGRSGTAGLGAGISAWMYLLTQCHAIVHYLWLAIWPAPLIFDYGFWTVRGLGEVWWQVLLLIGLGGATLLGLWRRPAAGFLGAWFFGILAASSSFVPVASQTMAEHRMYLALGAPVVAVMLGLESWLRRRALWLGVLLAIVLGGLTIRRNMDYRTEEAIWSDTVAKGPGNARAYGNLGHVYIEAGRWQEAIAASTEELKIDPDYRGDAHLNLGRALTELGRPAEAMPYFTEALRRKPDSFDVHNNFGVALAALGRWSEAITQYEAALRLRPDFAETHNNLANALAKTGRLPEALAHYAAASRLRPDFTEAEANWGRSLAEADRVAEALPHFERVLQLAPGAEAYEKLAAALAAAGRTGEAIPHYEAALRLQPNYVAAHYGLGNAFARLERFPEAISHYEAAVRLQPELAETQHNLAVALMRTGQPADAVGHYETTLRLMPESAAAHHDLALALGQLGRWAEAEMHEEAALKLQPDFAEAREHLAWLRRQ